MKTEKIELYVGVLHSKNEEEEIVEVFKITIHLSEIKECLDEIEANAKKLKYICIEKTPESVYYQSLNKKCLIEAYYLQRTVVVKKGKYAK